ncbi:unnamed protein product [Pleuronectes platessa]|uniref:Uncharacterized protein n=1 Tax=Pleuronectes platessa TaxID=8262 RepID=A0A9N7VZX9_PLEPL|nr:unnamed protein product [Pleuronectes platessa]
MANDKNSLGQLKDLVELKDQLEDIQRRMEDEIQAGVPPGGSLLASPFLKGFLAGYIVAKLRSSALLGVAVGTCTGIFAAQRSRDTAAASIFKLLHPLKRYKDDAKTPSNNMQGVPVQRHGGLRPVLYPDDQ